MLCADSQDAACSSSSMPLKSYASSALPLAVLVLRCGPSGVSKPSAAVSASGALPAPDAASAAAVLLAASGSGVLTAAGWVRFTGLLA
jgi:hypothetical protein